MGEDSTEGAMGEDSTSHTSTPAESPPIGGIQLVWRNK